MKFKRFTVCVICFGLPVVAQESKTVAPAEWQYVKEDDPLHAKVHDSFILDGVYLTPPRLSTGTPSLVVKCLGGKVEQNYLNVGAVVDYHEGGVVPVVAGLEVREDGKKTT